MSVKKGRDYEQRACEFLESYGFLIVERNFYSCYGEIDIIALKEGVLHFVEVKGSSRSNPVASVTPKKIDKILKTIDTYLMHRSHCGNYCFDVVAIYQEKIVFYENILF